MAYLERDVQTGEEVAIKYIPRGATVRAEREGESQRNRARNSRCAPQRGRPGVSPRVRSDTTC